jgi:hypothetical protein
MSDVIQTLKAAKALIDMGMKRSAIHAIDTAISEIESALQSGEPAGDRDALNDLWACAESGYSIDDLKAKIKMYLDTTPKPVVTEGQHLVPTAFLTEYLELLEASNFNALEKLVRREGVKALLSAGKGGE